MPAMDPDLLDAYRDAYASATASAAISRAARVTATAVKDVRPLSVLTEAEKLAHREQAAANMTLLGIFYAVTKLLLYYCIWKPARAIWQWVFEPVIFYVLFPCFLMVSLFLLVANVIRLNRWFGTIRDQAREQYDDFALNNTFLLDFEHGYASFKRAMQDMWLQVRYNETTDKIVRLWHEVYFLPDNIQRWLVRWWWAVPLAVFAVSWLRYSSSLQAKEYKMYELPPAFASQVPRWVQDWHLTRKEDGSNSHYKRSAEDAKVSEVGPVPYEVWVKQECVRPWGPDESVLAEPRTITETWTETVSMMPQVEVTMSHETRTVGWLPEPSETTVTITRVDGTTETVAITLTETRTSIQKGIEAAMRMETWTKTETRTMSIPHDASQHPAQHEDVREDYWAPPKGKTEIGDGLVYCRECNQFHCCELPY